MSFDLTSFFQSITTSPVTVLVFGLLLSLYLIFHNSKRLDISYFKYFDKFFQIIILGLLVSRIIFLVFNFSILLNLPWAILPQVKSENLYTYEIQRTWSLEVLPWKVFDFGSGINPAGFLLIFVVYFLLERKKYKIGDIKSGYKYFAHVRILSIPIITFITFVMLSLLVQFGTEKFFEEFFDIDLVFIIFLIIILAIIFLNVRQEKIEFDSGVRNSTRETADIDILKETAEQVRRERLLKRGIKLDVGIDKSLKTNFENIVGKILRKN